MTTEALIKAKIRTIPDWPQPGINFRDITTLFHHPETYRAVIDALAAEAAAREVDLIAAVDARGFILGGALAYKLGKPFSLVRKKGKLPHKTISQEYALEYGSAVIEVHQDACKPGDRILIVDDLIATGGTLFAAAGLFRALGGVVVSVAAIVDLPELGGSAKLRAAGLEVFATASYRENE